MHCQRERTENRTFLPPETRTVIRVVDCFAYTVGAAVVAGLVFMILQIV